jgi:D-3-phosphoglycerate dehydrogenase
LAEKLGSFLGQLTEAPIKGVRIEYEGAVAAMNTRALTSAAVTGVLRPFPPGHQHGVGARRRARPRHHGRGGQARERRARLRKLYAHRGRRRGHARHAGGTVFQDGKPRVTEIRHIAIDAEFAPHMIYVRNADQPGFIGAFGSLLGEAGVNIATFNLGRDRQGGDAICFVAVDEPVSPRCSPASRRSRR